MIKGHCECRRVQFEVDGEIEDFSHCHCSQCRRMHGAAFATFAGVAKRELRYISGENALTLYASSPSHERAFCSVCGSSIYAALGSEPETLYLSMSTLEGDPPRPRGYHIFVGSKAAWHEIADDLPRFEEDVPE